LFFFQNLYGLSQIGKLPLSDYEWLPKYHTSSFDIDEIDIDGEKGYILEVDLEYPEELHYHHNDFPLAPDSYKIELDDLSRYSKQCYKISNQNATYKSTKLTSTFLERKKYVVHIKNLKLYLQLGMKLKKIHRILMFKQDSFLEPFITKCTNERKKAKTVFEKNQYKKISNSCYGKTIENVRDYINVKIHTNEKSFKKAMSKHTFKTFSIIDENLVITSHRLPSIIHNKPYAVGFTILEYVSISISISILLQYYYIYYLYLISNSNFYFLFINFQSKHFMFDFFYNVLLKKCGRENIELLFSDTGKLN